MEDYLLNNALEKMHNQIRMGLEVSTGFVELDKVINGLQKGSLIILSGAPSIGKTAFALSMGKNIAVDQNKNVCYYSMNEGNMEITNKLFSNVGNIPLRKMQNGMLERFEWEQLDVAIGKLQEAPLFVDDTPRWDFDDLANSIKKMVADNGVRVVFIDTLQQVYINKMSHLPREQMVSQIVRELKALARELNIAIIAISQFNRNGDNTSTIFTIDKCKPRLSQLRESGEIENVADVVLLLHRWDYWKIYQNPNTAQDLRDIAEVVVAKNRNGATADIQIKHDLRFAKFEDIITTSNDLPLPPPMPNDGDFF